MKFFKKASTSSPPPRETNEEIPKKDLFQPIKQFFHFNRLEMKFLWWIFLASMFWSVYLISPLSKISSKTIESTGSPTFLVAFIRS